MVNNILLLILFAKRKKKQHHHHLHKLTNFPAVFVGDSLNKTI